jgi:hypothetical protein
LEVFGIGSFDLQLKAAREDHTAVVIWIHLRTCPIAAVLASDDHVRQFGSALIAYWRTYT